MSALAVATSRLSNHVHGVARLVPKSFFNYHNLSQIAVTSLYVNKIITKEGTECPRIWRTPTLTARIQGGGLMQLPLKPFARTAFLSRLRLGSSLPPRGYGFSPPWRWSVFNALTPYGTNGKPSRVLCHASLLHPYTLWTSRRRSQVVKAMMTVFLMGNSAKLPMVLGTGIEPIF